MSSLALYNFFNFSKPQFLHLSNGFNGFYFAKRISNNNENVLATSLVPIHASSANDGCCYNSYRLFLVMILS